MYAARADGALPKGYGRALLALHDKRPFVQSAAEVDAEAAEVRDAAFRITVAQDGIHVFNRALHARGTEALSFFPQLGVAQDGGHAFYLGQELAKAEIAWRLGKRYVQDEALDWGCAADPVPEDTTAFKEAGHTMRAGGGRS
jgi:dihydropteroate synthase